MHVPIQNRKRVWLAALAVALASGCGPKNPVELTFQVTAPLDTPAGAEVRLVGDAPPLGNGKAPGLMLTRVAEGTYRGQAILEAGSTLRYRVALGSPEAVELTSNFDPAPERELQVPTRKQTVSVPVARWWYPAPPTHAAVKFEVRTPATSPTGLPYLAGNAAELGGWRPAGVPLTRRSSDGVYVALVALPKGAAIQFKVTRGSWETVERGPAGEDIPNRTYAVPEEGGTALASVATWKDQVPSAVLTGTIRYQTGVTSAILGNTRDVIVYLPPDYESSTARYPVLYMHDGQNLMDPRTTSFGNPDWGVDETAQRLIRNGQMEPIIVVGVYNTTARIDEYTQAVDRTYGGGKADDYGRFLVEELKPRIDATYRTRTGATSTGIAGSSLGGLVSLYLGMTRPDVFTRVGAVSPSIWWAGRDIVTRTQALPGKLPLRIWADMGTGEGEVELVNVRLERDALIAKGWTLDADFRYLEIAGALHNEAAWAARLDQILMYLYPPPP